MLIHFGFRLDVTMIGGTLLFEIPNVLFYIAIPGNAEWNFLDNLLYSELYILVGCVLFSINSFLLFKESCGSLVPDYQQVQSEHWFRAGIGFLIGSLLFFVHAILSLFN